MGWISILKKKKRSWISIGSIFWGPSWRWAKKRRKEKKEARFTYFFLLKKLSFYNIKTFFYNFWGLQTLYFFIFIYIYIYANGAIGLGLEPVGP